ncbi:MAG: TIGR02646 family protein [Candidatus Sericytochromatia bacterium]|nr:TIGR02646 family protein [Candidatus Sericytochromatia bacterium]
MKHIVKQPEPPDFVAWKAQANADWQPSYALLSGAPKRALKQALMQEQGYLCCYCEQSLTDADSHIEHFNPQHLHAGDDIAYKNLLCSCLNERKKGNPIHCGALKDDWFDLGLLISPLDPTCESRFQYLDNGKIQPAQSSDLAAQTTIAKLGLDIAKLNEMRNKALEPFLDETLTQEALQTFVSEYLKQDAEGRWSPFWTTVQALYGAWVV